MENIHHITQSLFDYIADEIIPRYDNFDAGHRRDHATAVIDASMSLATRYDVSRDMVFAIAAFHDTGLCDGREHHHIRSAEIVRADRRLREWFSPAEIETIADAVCDHRASNSYEPRSIYGKIVAEADRIIIPDTILRRASNTGWHTIPPSLRQSKLPAPKLTSAKNTGKTATCASGFPNRPTPPEWQNCAR